MLVGNGIILEMIDEVVCFIVSIGYDFEFGVCFVKCVI